MELHTMNMGKLNMNPLNQASVHILQCFPHQETKPGTCTTVILKIYSKKKLLAIST
jgi:hypothetical protein